MESKKNTKVDLKKWYGTLLNLGLVTSVGLTLLAFEWKSYPTGELKEINSFNEVWDIIDIPQTIQSPPPPPQQAIELIEQPNEIEIDDLSIEIDVFTTETEELPEIVLPESAPKVDIADEIVDFTEVQATFKGGMEAWFAYLRKNLNYPNQARRLGIEGTVLVRFVVNKDGSVQDVEVLRGVGGGCDLEATEVIQNSPAWNPGKMRGLPVRSRIVIPIKFQLN